MLARGYPLAQLADGKNKAKMEVRCGRDIQTADAAGAAGSTGNDANDGMCPAGRARSLESSDSVYRRAGSSADNGRDMRGGGAYTEYSDEAVDQEAERRLLEGAGLWPIWRAYFSPQSPGSRDAIPFVSDDTLMVAEMNNRRVASVRLKHGHWGTPPGFIEVLADAQDDDIDAVVAEMHGDSNYGNQGEARPAYEVLDYAIELVRYETPFHDFHTSLYAWAPLFGGHQMWKFEKAPNNLGRLPRAWSEAVFLSSLMAKELSVSLANNAGMQEYVEELIEV